MDKLKQAFQSIAHIKKKQRFNLGICLILIVVVGWGIYAMVSDDNGVTHLRHDKNVSVNMTDPLTHVNESSVWIERTQNTLAKTLKTTQSLEQQLQRLNSAKTDQEKSNQTQNQQVQALQNQVNELAQKLIQSNTNHNAANNAANGATFPPASADSPTSMRGVSEDVLTLTPQNTAWPVPVTPSRTPDTYVPAGSFVRAVMIGGADASAGVSSQGNPSPMLFRLLDQGTLPNHHKSHLKDCTATAAVVGDISSERGQIRLERLSCVAPHGEIIDMPVEGTVFGPEGKNGVRGIPLWREGALLKRAFMAGTLSGLSSGISQQYTTTSTSALGSTTSVNDGELFKYGAASGMSSAMDKMADYNIRRADQYHPVIQLSAGTVVDIVFLKGFFLDGEKHDDPKKETVLPPFGMTTTQSNPGVTTISPPSALPLTQKQIETLKQQTAAQGGL